LKKLAKERLHLIKQVSNPELKKILFRTSIGSCGSNLQLSEDVSFTDGKQLHLGHHVVIMDHVHFDDRQPIRIGNHVIIGSHTVIHPGVTIDDGVFIEPNSLITTSIKK